MLSENPTVIERSLRPTIPVQEGTFLLYPDNQRFLQGESDQLTAINWVNRHLVVELAFRYITLFIFVAVFLPLVNTGELNGWAMVGALLLIPIIIWIGYLLEKQFNRYMNRRTTKRYEQEGQLVSGVLESCGRGSLFSFDGSKLLFVYTFTNPKGETIRGKLGERYRTFGRRPIPEAGSPVVILYFNDNEHFLL